MRAQARSSSSERSVSDGHGSSSGRSGTSQLWRFKRSPSTRPESWTMAY